MKANYGMLIKNSNLRNNFLIIKCQVQKIAIIQNQAGANPKV